RSRIHGSSSNARHPDFVERGSRNHWAFVALGSCCSSCKACRAIKRSERMHKAHKGDFGGLDLEQLEAIVGGGGVFGILARLVQPIGRIGDAMQGDKGLFSSFWEKGYADLMQKEIDRDGMDAWSREMQSKLDSANAHQDPQPDPTANGANPDADPNYTA